MEMPECPVCLQTYDSEEAIPRVLPCGHSACSPCIAQLAAAADSSSGRSFPDTIRCPACNQVVPCPRGRGANALPKNIDLLRLCSAPSPSSTSSPRPGESLPPERGAVLFQIPWDEQLFSTWKDWILPCDAVSVAAVDDTAAEAVAATLIRASSCGRFEESHYVRLVTVGESSSSISTTTACGQFKLSYTGRVMEALNKLGEKERAELGLIMATSFRQRRGLCRAFGLWMSSLESSPLFLVCERFQFDLSRALNDVAEHNIGLGRDHEVFSFAKLCMESCECLIALHSQSMVCGCLALSCFCFDDYGHCLLDVNEVLLVGRRVKKDVAEARRSNSRSSLSKGQTFVSPELLTALYSEHTVSEFRSGIDYGSDVWSLACVLTVLLVGERQVDVELSEALTGDNGVELSLDVYDVWKKKVASALEASLLGTKLESLLPILESCLDYDPVSRPSVSDIWRCIVSIFYKSHCIVPPGLDVPVPRMDILCCLVLGDLSCLPKGRNHVLEGTEKLPDDHSILAFTESSVELFQQEKTVSDSEGFPDRGFKFVSLQGHQDCITGLAVGGGFLFSSSFDKTVRVWSLEDFSLVQTLRGHEHRVMAILVVDAIKPLCITGDSGGCICAWSIDSSTEKVPLRKWYDHTDWRYSGVHSLAVSGSQYLYSGSGDKTIKAWSLQDYSLTCTMTGHKSAISSLLASDGILYSGSWDGTIRLWWLHDHSPLTVLGDDELLKGSSVLSLLLHNQLLVASFDNGSLKMWRNDVLVKSAQIQNGALFAVEMDGKWLFMGGWDKIIHIQELSENESQVELRSVGSISCDSVVTSLLHWQGKLFAGSYKDIKAMSVVKEQLLRWKTVDMRRGSGILLEEGK
ncbi:hypothetical protein Taro_036718 [Colocasia esculenta]|uniref:Uncharacterized protein n=1 Tax=Colocasia esculenta TaxID=4460 RepID=A0A843WE61_COLES|nr:hypothetical protein [Colocasia esculenta]